MRSTSPRTGLPVITVRTLSSKYFFASGTASRTVCTCFDRSFVVTPG